jgi:hypothetical protein
VTPRTRIGLAIAAAAGLAAALWPRRPVHRYDPPQSQLPKPATRPRFSPLRFLRCWWRDRHDGVRHPLGGFWCRSCGFAGVDQDEMGYRGTAYVQAQRRVFNRDGHRPAGWGAR